MASGGYGPVLRQVDRLLGVHGTASGLGEGALLRRFADGRDEAAFEALVTRHGPMVLGTCRRILADPHDVDDAFQATFLVLARKAGSIRDGDRLGPWLHGVARRVATRSRTLSARRAARERPGAEERASAGADPSELVELRAALDEELARLPEKYRAPLVLCYLEGLTHDEAAVQLSWPVGTVRSRLARGRDRLRSRLTRRGLSPSAAVPAILPAPAIPEVLISSTVRIATAAGSAPAHVASLAKGALIAMMWHKIRAIAAVGLVAGLAAGGAGAVARQAAAGRAAPAEGPGKEPDATHQQANINENDPASREARLAALEKLVGQLTAQLESARKAAAPPGPAPEPPAPAATVAVDAPPRRRDAQPIVHTLPGTPTLFAVISAARDRVTIINSDTRKRATFHMPGGATEIVPVVSGDLVGLIARGAALTRTAVYDRKGGGWSEAELGGPATEVLPWIGNSALGASRQMVGFQVTAPEVRRLLVYEGSDAAWHPQELREPARGTVAPQVGGAIAQCRIAKTLYIYSSFSKTWSALDLKRNLPGRPDFSGSSPDGAGRITIPDGDTIHIYDSRAGEWTHIDTRDEG